MRSLLGGCCLVIRVLGRSGTDSTSGSSSLVGGVSGCFEELQPILGMNEFFNGPNKSKTNLKSKTELKMEKIENHFEVFEGSFPVFPI